MASLTFRTGELDDDRVRALIRRHLAGMHENTPAEGVFALDLDGLRGPNLTFWSGWVRDDIAVIGALKQLDESNGEIKSMRVADAYLGIGAGRQMLRTIIAEAERIGLSDLWLETGGDESFQAALGLYRSEGFVETGAFGDYPESGWSVFMRKTLGTADER